LIEIYKIFQEYLLIENSNPQYLNELLQYTTEGWKKLNQINLED